MPMFLSKMAEHPRQFARLQMKAGNVLSTGTIALATRLLSCFSDSPAAYTRSVNYKKLSCSVVRPTTRGSGNKMEAKYARNKAISCQHILDLLFGIRTIWHSREYQISPFHVFAGIRTPEKTPFWPLLELGLSMNPFLKIQIVNYLKSKSN